MSDVPTEYVYILPIIEYHRIDWNMVNNLHSFVKIVAVLNTKNRMKDSTLV